MKIYQIKVYDADAMSVSTHLTTSSIRWRKEGEEEWRIDEGQLTFNHIF